MAYHSILNREMSYYNPDSFNETMDNHGYSSYPVSNDLPSTYQEVSYLEENYQYPIPESSQGMDIPYSASSMYIPQSTAASPPVYLPQQKPVGPPMYFPQPINATQPIPIQPSVTIPVTTVTVPTSVFPPLLTPQGSPISVFLEDNSHHQKRNRRLGGAGVTAVACAATGGLILLPVIAGVAVNKLVKKSKEKCVYAYANTYIYELRSALAHGLGVPPELLQLKRNGVMLDDCFQLSQYLQYPGKNRIHITMHIKDIPVVGSVCTYEGQYIYPDPLYVDCSNYQFVS